jgi:hypothetical protein
MISDEANEAKIAFPSAGNSPFLCPSSHDDDIQPPPVQVFRSSQDQSKLRSTTDILPPRTTDVLAHARPRPDPDPRLEVDRDRGAAGDC